MARKEKGGEEKKGKTKGDDAACISYVLEISSRTERSVCRPLSVPERAEKKTKEREKEKRDEKGRLRFCVARGSSQRPCLCLLSRSVTHILL